VILGLPWLKEYNPKINWKTGTVELVEPTTKEQLARAIRITHTRKNIRTTEVNEQDPPETILAVLKQERIPKELGINAKTNTAQELAMKESEKKKPKTLEEMIPAELMAYQDVFDKKKAERFPESRPWDHAIDLKPDFIPKDCKVYPLTVQEQGEMNKFIDENLAKGYI
jgi:hypothetical protein